MGYGLRPVGKGFGGVTGYNNGSAVEIPIADGYTVNIFSGDFVERTTGGTVIRQNGSTGESPTTTNITAGVAVGFRYVDPNGSPVWSNFYLGNASNTNAFALVCTDPNQLYMIQGDEAVTLTTGYPTEVGCNAAVVTFAASSGSTVTGNSGIALDVSSAATTAALACRIVAVPDDGENLTSSTPNIIVRLNTAVLQDDQGTGQADS